MSPIRTGLRIAVVVGTVAAGTVPIPTGVATAAVPTVRRVGRIDIGPCAVTGRGVDPALGVLILVRSMDTTCGYATAETRIEAYATRTGRRVASTRLTTGRTGDVDPVIDATRHRLLLTESLAAPAVPNRVLAIRVNDLLHNPRELTPEVVASIPSNTAELAAISPETVASPQNPASSAGDFSVVPKGVTYDAVDDVLYATLVQDFGGLPSATSAHGPGSQGMYLVRASLRTGRVEWVFQLGQCVFSLSTAMLFFLPTQDDPLVVTRERGKASVAAACITTRAPSFYPNPYQANGGGNADGIRLQDGAGLVYRLPLDRAGAIVTSAVTFRQGRPHVRGGFADTSAERLFFVNTPGDTRAGSSGSGPAAVTWDGASNHYVGAPTIGSHDDTGGGFAVTAAAGRMYAVSRDGVTVVDDALTPPGQGTVTTEYRCSARAVSVDTRVHRLFVEPRDKCSATGEPTRFIDILSDELPRAAPPIITTEGLTQQIPESDTTIAQFSGSASAMSLRMRLVGGVTGFVNGATLDAYALATGATGAGPPKDYKNHEISLAQVGKVDLGEYQSLAHAIVADADPDTQKVMKEQTSRVWPYREVICSTSARNAADDVAYGDDAASVVTCAARKSATGTATVGAFGFTALLGSDNSIPVPVRVGGGDVRTTTQREPQRGIVTSASAITRGISVGPVTIDSVRTSVTCVAHGHRGTASCTFVRAVNGVAIAGQQVFPETCTERFSPTDDGGECQPMLDRLNQVAPGQMVFSAVSPDMRDGHLIGSPDGYQAVAQRELYRHLEDSVLNADESMQIPGLSVLLLNDSPSQPSRVDLQFAPVESEARYGIQSGEEGCTEDCDVVTPPKATPQPTSPSVVLRPTPEPRVKNVAGGDTGGDDDDGIAGAIGHLIKRIFNGVRWLLRSPGQGVLVGLVLTLICQPFFLSRRRRRLELLLEGTA